MRGSRPTRSGRSRRSSRPTIATGSIITAVKEDSADPDITISDSDVTYIDHAGDAQYQISKLNLSTGRVANGVTTPIDLSATVAAPKQKAQVELKLKTRLTALKSCWQALSPSEPPQKLSRKNEISFIATVKRWRN